MRNVTLSIVFASLALGGILLGAGCQSDTSDQRSLLSPAAAKEIPTFPGAGNFVAQITNPYMNFAPGRIPTIPRVLSRFPRQHGAGMVW